MVVENHRVLRHVLEQAVAQVLVEGGRSVHLLQKVVHALLVVDPNQERRLVPRNYVMQRLMAQAHRIHGERVTQLRGLDRLVHKVRHRLHKLRGPRGRVQICVTTRDQEAIQPLEVLVELGSGGFVGYRDNPRHKSSEYRAPALSTNFT